MFTIPNLTISRVENIKAVGASNLPGRVQDFIFREELGKDVKACDTYEDLLRDPNVDIIYIAVESSAHCDLVCRAAEVGKHVLCEKPMGLNFEEIQRMKQSAKQHDTFLMESHSSCFHPAWRALNRGIGSKEFGDVWIISAHIGANDTNQSHGNAGGSGLNNQHHGNAGGSGLNNGHFTSVDGSPSFHVGPPRREFNIDRYVPPDSNSSASEDDVESLTEIEPPAENDENVEIFNFDDL
ncbi:oxidoreductase family, NAD-binding rossmann fold domain-containing protein [Ditylenchus destructor]|nr:oxidoreductase family, NAD-binding rossmann fold domain-containing protein [Ditylenchus destructor]